MEKSLKYARKHTCWAYEQLNNQKCSVGPFVALASKSIFLFLEWYTATHC